MFFGCVLLNFFAMFFNFKLCNVYVFHCINKHSIVFVSLKQKLSMYAKRFHKILSEFTSFSKWGLVGK
jgi:hypothetical protein